MAKVRRKRSPPPSSPAEQPPPPEHPSMPPPEQAAAWRQFAAELPEAWQKFAKAKLPEAWRAKINPLEQIEAWRKFAKTEREQRERAARERAKLNEGRKLLDRQMAFRDGLIGPPWRKGVQPADAPKLQRPKGLGLKAFETACTILALCRAGDKWISLAALKKLVDEKIGSKVSMGTVNAALHWLRKEGHIDR